VPRRVLDVDEALWTIAAERIDVVLGPATLYS